MVERVFEVRIDSDVTADDVAAMLHNNATVLDLTPTHAARERVVQRAMEVQRAHASKRTWERLNALSKMLDAAEELLALESGAKEQA